MSARQPLALADHSPIPAAQMAHSSGESGAGPSPAADAADELQQDDDIEEIVHAPDTLPATLTMWNGVGLITGVMIGSGIFASPGSVLLEAGSPGLALMAWISAGLIAFVGSACYAELGTVVPDSGGEYVYIAAGLNELLAFLFTWASSLITRPGSVAIVVLVAGDYLMRPFYSGVPPSWVVKLVSVLLATILLIINSVSVKASTRMQDITTVLKFVALIMVSIIGLVFLARHHDDKGQPAYDNFHNMLHADTGISLTKFGAAIIAGCWSYDGWNNLSFCTAEMKNPTRDLPRALLIGVPSVIVAYVFANVAYFSVLPLDAIVNFERHKTNDAFAADFASTALGTAGRVIIPLCIAASAFGSGNDIIAVIMVVSGSFASLVDYFSAAAWVFYFLAVLSLLSLRRRRPDAPRPFRVPAGVAVVFLCAAAFLVVSLVIQSPVNSSISLGFLLAGVPVFYARPLWRRFCGPAAARSGGGSYQPIDNTADGTDI